jgi:hypothetical protein
MVHDHRSVVGFHGTSEARAEVIVCSGEFIPSKNEYDWLGHGIYFWEHAPLRAWQWARQKYRDRAAVVEATIELGTCLDLTDLRYTSALRLSYEMLREAFLRNKTPLPMNRNKARLLDCLVVNYLTSYILPECETVRAPFLEGDPIYEGSMLLNQSHVQLVARSSRCIITKPKRIDQEVIDGLRF